MATLSFPLKEGTKRRVGVPSPLVRVLGSVILFIELYLALTAVSHTNTD